MNIFKILDSGDGTIKEPNLSAFLGYLLNPKADHGLSSAFLQKVLEPFLQNSDNVNPLLKLSSSIVENDDGEEPYILDLSIQSRFNVEVVLEKALRRKNNIERQSTDQNKEIVDIIVKITERKEIKREDISYLFEKETPVAIILIENKIHYSKVEKQLLRQYQNSFDELPYHMSSDDWLLWKDKICTILISTGEKDYEQQFQRFKNADHIIKTAIHLIWDNDTEVKTIKSILLEILNESNSGVIAPIPTYTCDTLRALINYIENEFSSDADDQQRGGKKQTVKYYGSLEDTLINGDGHFKTMHEEMKRWIREFDMQVQSMDEFNRHYTKNRITVEHNGKKIYNIQYQNMNNFIIHYLSAAKSFGSDDKEYKNKKGEFHYYERKNINITDPVSVAIEYLNFTKNNQLVKS